MVDHNEEPESIDPTYRLRMHECPGVDGIIFGDGRVRSMDLYWDYDVGCTVEVNDWTTLSEIAKDGELEWSLFGASCDVIEPELKLRAACGEGDNGGEGIVVVTDSDTGGIHWIARFINSGRFEHVNVSEAEVAAKTTGDVLWRFHFFDRGK